MVKMTFYRETNFRKTASGEIPKDWRFLKLGDVCSKITDGTHKTPKYVEKGIPFLSTQNIIPFRQGFDFSQYEKYITAEEHKELIRRCRPEKGDILISKCGTIGRTKLVDVDYEFSIFVGVALLKLQRDLVSGGFLEQLFNYKPVRMKMEISSPGSTRRTLTINAIEKLSIPLPSFEEQQKIAEILSVVDLAIQKTDEVIAKTERLKRGLMQELLTKGIGHKEFRYSKELGYEIPKEWEVVKYKKANERIFVGIATSSTKHFCMEGVPFIRNQNIKEKGIDLSDLVFITRSFSEANKSKMLRENDILTVRTGYPGLSCKVTKEMEGWHTFTTLISRPNLAEFDPDYLVYILNSPICKVQISCLQAGMAQQNLNVGWIVNLKILKPPKAEQMKIAEWLKVIYRLLRVEEAYLGKLRLIKRGLMHDLLSGKIRVKVD